MTAILSQEDLATILGPVWVAFAASAVRIRELAETPHDHVPLYCRRCDALKEAKAYLHQRALGFDGVGLTVALDTGARLPLLWPNAYPQDGTIHAELKRWLDAKPEVRAKLQAWKEEDDDFLASVLERYRAKFAEQAQEERRAS